MGVGIALGPWSQPREGGQGGLGINPMSFMMDAVKLRGEMTQFNANQELGGIIASTKTPEEAIAAARRSPNSAYMLPALTQLQEQQLRQAQTGEVTTRVSGLRAENGARLMANATNGARTEADYRSIVNGGMEGLDPETRAAEQPFINSQSASVLDGLDNFGPAGSPQREMEFKRRQLAQQVLIGGITPDRAYGAQGGVAPQLTELGADPITGEPRRSVVSGGGGLPLSVGGSAQDWSSGRPLGSLGQQPTGGGAGTGGVITAAGPGVTKAIEDIRAENTTAVQSAPIVLQQLDSLHDALQHFYAGGLADKRVFLAKDAQGVKGILRDIAGQEVADKYIPDSLIEGIGNKGMAASQFFQSTIRQYATEAMKQAVGQTGAGRLNAELQAFLTSMDVTTDPRALIDLLNKSKNSVRVAVDRADHFNDFLGLLRSGDESTRNMTAADYYTWHSNNRMNKLDETWGGRSLKPYTTEGVLGAEPEKSGQDTEKKAADDLKKQHDDLPAGTRRNQRDTKGVLRGYLKNKTGGWDEVPLQGGP